jgi:hypothetical protein
MCHRPFRDMRITEMGISSRYLDDLVFSKLLNILGRATGHGEPRAKSVAISIHV